MAPTASALQPQLTVENTTDLKAYRLIAFLRVSGAASLLTFQLCLMKNAFFEFRLPCLVLLSLFLFIGGVVRAQSPPPNISCGLSVAFFSQSTGQAGGLPNGLYFLQVVAEGKVWAVEKFVKQ